MTSETAGQALEFGLRQTGDSCGIVFFGGEPLLCQDLIRETVSLAGVISQRCARRFHFKLTTNGLLLDEPFLEFALRNDILIALSLDGVRESHDLHRRLPNGESSFRIVLERLRLLLSMRPYASVLMTVNPDTVRYLAESVAFLVDQGCRYLVISLNYAAHWLESDIDALRHQYERMADYYLRQMRAGRKFYLSPIDVKLASHIQGDGAGCQRCELGMRQLSVDPQGYLYPCVQFTAAGPESAWCIGHVATGLDRLARDRLHAQLDAEKESCRDCALRHRCHHTCGCLNWQTTGSINCVSGVLCRHEQMLIPIADRAGAVLYGERNPEFLRKHYDPAYPFVSLLEDLTGNGDWH